MDELLKMNGEIHETMHEAGRADFWGLSGA